MADDESGGKRRRAALKAPATRNRDRKAEKNQDRASGS